MISLIFSAGDAEEQAGFSGGIGDAAVLTGEREGINVREWVERAGG